MGLGRKASQPVDLRGRDVKAPVAVPEPERVWAELGESMEDAAARLRRSRPSAEEWLAKVRRL